MVAHVDRWFAGPRTATDRALLLVLDVDIDDALPTDEAVADVRRRRLLRTVEVAVDLHARPDDALARVDAGRFAILRTAADGDAPRSAADALGRAVEDALAGSADGYGARVTVGATCMDPASVRPGRAVLGAVTTTMLEGKLLTDGRLVVALARD